MNNVEPGGKLFFLNKDGGPKRIAFWADFIEAPLVTVDDAWEQYGSELGAATQEDWIDLVHRLPNIWTEFRLIRSANAFAPDLPIGLRDAGVVEVKHAPKGWSIEQSEVDRILEFGNPPTVLDLEPPSPVRVTVTVNRVVRDTVIARWVKRQHKHECQICGTTIELPDGRRYSEGHHIQPLGAPHDGPDVACNILCVCPNHHAACDLGAIQLLLGDLRQADGHTIAPEFVAYHNRVIYRGVTNDAS